MTDVHELAGRLARLGDALDLDDADLAGVVLARLDRPPPGARPRGRLAVAVAAAAVGLVAGAVVHPGSRDAMARWFGLDGVTVDVDPQLSLPPAPPSFDAPGPGESRVVVVGGREILVSAISGTLDDTLIEKTVGSSAQVREVDVKGRPGLWISGAPHEVLYESPRGDVAVERVATDTLLWQDGTTLFRVEGFDELVDALAFAEGT